MTNRRSFLKLCSSGTLAIGLGITSMALSCASIFADILKYVPVALQAFTAILDILSGGGIAIGADAAITMAINLVKAGFADLQVFVQQYDSAPAADKSTLAGKIATGINLVIGDIQAFWVSLKLPDSDLAAIVQGLLAIILSTLEGFLPSLPAPVSAAALTVHIGKAIAYTPQKRSVKQFRKDFNAQLAKSGYKPKL